MVTTMVRQKIKVEQWSQEDEGFWEWMGKWFASKELKKTLDVAMNSDPDYAWFLAFSEGELVGFCAVTPEKTGSRLRYVHAINADSHVLTQIVAAAVTASTKPIYRLAKELDVEFYDRFEFKRTGRTKGAYVELVKGSR